MLDCWPQPRTPLLLDSVLSPSLTYCVAGPLHEVLYFLGVSHTPYPGDSYTVYTRCSESLQL